MVRLPAVEHVGKAARYPVGCIEHGVFGKVRIAEGGLDVGMAEQPGDGAQALAPADRDRSVAIAEIVNAQRRQARRRADRVPFVVYRCGRTAGSDFGVDVGGVEADMPEPRADGVEIDAGLQQMAGACVTVLTLVKRRAYSPVFQRVRLFSADG